MFVKYVAPSICPCCEPTVVLWAVIKLHAHHYHETAIGLFCLLLNSHTHMQLSWYAYLIPFQLHGIKKKNSPLWYLSCILCVCVCVCVCVCMCVCVCVHTHTHIHIHIPVIVFQIQCPGLSCISLNFPVCCVCHTFLQYSVLNQEVCYVCKYVSSAETERLEHSLYSSCLALI